MKKVVVGLVAVMAALMMCICFAGCGNGISSLQKKYEDAGYTCSVAKTSEEDIKKAEEKLEGLEGEEKEQAKKALNHLKKTEILTVSKGIVPMATITYVPNIDDYKASISENAWKTAEEKGYIKGKLVFTPIASVFDDEVLNIFKK